MIRIRSLLPVLVAAISAGCAVFGEDTPEPAPSASPDPSTDGGEGGAKCPVVTPTAPAGTILLQPLPNETFVIEGQSTKIPVRVTRGAGVSEPIDLHVVGLVNGLKATGRIAANQTEGALTIDATATTRQGSQSLTIEATVPTSSTKPTPSTTTKTKVFVRGASGSLDTTFGIDGLAAPLPGSSTRLFDAAVLPDNRFVVVGQSDGVIIVARFSADGVFDTSFGDQGMASTTLTYQAGEFPRIAIDGAGRLLVSGEQGSQRQPAVARLTANGQADTSFGTQGTAVVAGLPFGADGTYDIAAGPQNSVYLVATSSYTFLGLVRLTSSGTLDTTFASPLGYRTIRNLNSSPYYYLGGRLSMGADGTAIVAYTIGAGDGVLQTGLMATAVSPNGTSAVDTVPALDESPGSDFIVVARGKDSRSTLAFPSPEGKLRLHRYESDLSRDMAFGTAGIAEAFPGRPSGIQLLAGGKALVAGTMFPAQHVALARFNANGSLDVTFGTQGVVELPMDSQVALDMVVQSDERAIVVGSREYPWKSLVVRVWQ